MGLIHVSSPTAVGEVQTHISCLPLLTAFTSFRSEPYSPDSAIMDSNNQNLDSRKQSVISDVDPHQARRVSTNVDPHDARRVSTVSAEPSSTTAVRTRTSSGGGTSSAEIEPSDLEKGKVGLFDLRLSSLTDDKSLHHLQDMYSGTVNFIIDSPYLSTVKMLTSLRLRGPSLTVGLWEGECLMQSRVPRDERPWQWSTQHTRSIP